jgi:flagellar hook assembly protein FlgD
MLFTELKISDSAASVITHMNKIERKNLSVSMNPSHCIIQYKTLKTQNQKAISIYSPHGIVIKKITLSDNGYAVWNYTDNKGASVSAGRYFVTVGHSRSEVLPIDVIH